MRITKDGILVKEMFWKGECQTCLAEAIAKQSTLTSIKHNQREGYFFSWEKCLFCGAGEYGGVLFKKTGCLISRLVVVKCFESEKGEQHPTPSLSGYLRHPDRYRYRNCWRRIVKGVSHCQIVGGEGWFAFPDNFCPKFLGEYPAIILEEIDESRHAEDDIFTVL